MNMGEHFVERDILIRKVKLEIVAIKLNQGKSIIKLVRAASSACKAIPDEVVRADYARRLIVLAFNLRDIRGTFGKGERTLFYWWFIELYNMNMS